MGRKGKKLDKAAIVVGVNPNNYEVQDLRLMKPECHQKLENGALVGSMLIQQIDNVTLNRKNKLAYFLPNNIALLLDTSNKALANAKEIYNKEFLNSDVCLDFEEMEGDRIANINTASSLVCDYIQFIQTSIVFGYTALEAFSNLSIPEDCEYKIEKNTKGIAEIYDKKAIERWLPLKLKIQDILTDIYGTPKLEGQKWWGWFANLEDYRNELVHQKSITHTEIYKYYFKPKIFQICNSPKLAIEHFHDSYAEKNRTNPIWPWLSEGSKVPINTEYQSSKFEVVGNIYEGVKK